MTMILVPAQPQYDLILREIELGLDNEETVADPEVTRQLTSIAVDTTATSAERTKALYLLCRFY